MDEKRNPIGVIGKISIVIVGTLLLLYLIVNIALMLAYDNYVFWIWKDVGFNYRKSSLHFVRPFESKFQRGIATEVGYALYQEPFVADFMCFKRYQYWPNGKLKYKEWLDGFHDQKHCCRWYDDGRINLQSTEVFTETGTHRTGAYTVERYYRTGALMVKARLENDAVARPLANGEYTLDSSRQKCVDAVSYFKDGKVAFEVIDGNGKVFDYRGYLTVMYVLEITGGDVVNERDLSESKDPNAPSNEDAR